MHKDIMIHKTSEVEEGADLGQGTQIWHFSHIMKGAKIGKNCKIGQNVVIHPTAKIGNNVKIQNNVSVYDGVELEDDVFCGPSCVFTNIVNPRSAVPRNSADFYQKTRVKQGATIGANATILCGTTIGRHAFIGAGAVVTKSVGDYELVYGNPAVPKGWMCACGVKLQFANEKAVCESCQRQYAMKGHQIQVLS